MSFGSINVNIGQTYVFRLVPRQQRAFGLLGLSSTYSFIVSALAHIGDGVIVLTINASTCTNLPDRTAQKNRTSQHVLEQRHQKATLINDLLRLLPGICGPAGSQKLGENKSIIANFPLLQFTYGCSSTGGIWSAFVDTIVYPGR